MSNKEPAKVPLLHKGRGATSNISGRFEGLSFTRESDGWQTEPDIPERLTTSAIEEKSKTITATNQSPDIPFSQSINPYRGCEHGCVYCYARPAHAYMDLSPGLDFETKIFFKPNAAALLEQALRKKNYHCSPIALGTNTDPYQPLEREKRITQTLLQVMQEFRQPVTIVTKSQLVLRDLPLLTEMAQDNLAQIAISVTTLDNTLKRKLEPRTAGPSARLRTIEQLSSAGIPTAVLAAPMIPALNDSELESILTASRESGAERAAYILLRLPHEVAPLFREWLEVHYPEKAKHVMSLVQQSRGGKDYQSDFSHRRTGTGVFAQLLQQRFKVAVKRLGLDHRRLSLDCSQFMPPPLPNEQQDLFS
ncbi:PA0069 family radical SAM protein [Microbulbifer sp. OS29]|uniref:PA0069 family radical SAM protein n=1 Tax=Microbulbifer okhotskensis TaxID=2926617 RepID=A0A9X2ELV5_9GAMM|nr:PA0069 family radical SAM protein [Microbulbifer okhotskensis]MCO1334061.1 PA0069 family radical SAM protein [Microbulbifer okhotskensis]